MKVLNKTFQKEEIKIVDQGNGEKYQIKHTEWDCRKCPRNTNAVSKQRCDLYKAIKGYLGAKACKDEITQEIFKKYARAKQIIKYEIGIFKELEQRKENDEIKLIGICNSQYDANKALRENKGDEVRLAIIKEDIADGDAISEYYDDGESNY